jgi:propionyl-CoA carboxylase beta chain
VHSLSGYGRFSIANVLSGLVPQIAIIAGPCAGGAAYSPALMDFLIMTRKNAQMFICGPDVIKAATGQEAPIEQFGTAEAHASVSGNIHFVPKTTSTRWKSPQAAVVPAAQQHAGSSTRASRRASR